MSESFVNVDEGMWTIDNLPVEQLKKNYGFTPSPDWVEHLQKSSVRFNDGGSGAFVSNNGLLLTNHHVALGQLQKMSSPEKDYVKDGFFAHGLAEEIQCPDLEINILDSLENVTQRVLSAAKGKMSEKISHERRKSEISRITKESAEKTGLRSDVVELYQGGEYWLYRYKKFKDVRLVMAPELQAAFYGGDPDNFTYPRYAMDFAFFRAYHDGKPLATQHFLKWSQDGAAAGELVFVTGHPGHTDRMMTVSQLKSEREKGLPLYLEIARKKGQDCRDYAALGEEQERRIKERIFGIDNSIKAVTGAYEGLLDRRLFNAKQKSEKELRAFVMKSKSPEVKAARGSWTKIAAAIKKSDGRRLSIMYRRYDPTKIAAIAAQIVRYVVEVEKPNDKRWEEYRDSNLDSLRFRLFSPAPMYADMEQFLMERTLQDALDALGPRDEYVRLALNGRSPADVAREVVLGTELFQPEKRRALVEGGQKAVAHSTDPLIVWVRKLDRLYRAQRKWLEDEIESVLVEEGRKIAVARFAMHGKSLYPDATFTLRLSYGKVAGYECGTTQVAPFTTFYGLFDRAIGHGEKKPFDLAARVRDSRQSLNLSTKINFVTTNDIIGGNSGSPVVNARGEYVGLIFDGNIQSLAGRYAYEPHTNRAVAVHSSGILEAMRVIYGMNDLVNELV
jgi:hypothetical protein